MTDLAGKKVLITGASSGIGEEIAKELAAAGAVVGLCARRTAHLDRVLEACRASSPESKAWTVDLADLAGIESFADRVVSELGPVDVLVNNAGVVAANAVDVVTFGEVEALMRINYLSPVRLTLALLPGMLGRGAGQILNVSSVAARLAPPTEAAYGATKAALTSFFEAAAADLWMSGVTIHNLFPGFIKVNDDPPNELHVGIEATPARDVAIAARRQLEAGNLEVYIPADFARLAAGRAKDVAAFVAASAEFARQQTERHRAP